MAEPILRKFILADIDGNHNKVWQIKWWPDTCKCITEWGRVGESMQSKEFTGWTEWMVDNKVAEKQRKGYVELKLHTPTAAAAPTPSVDPIVNQFIQWVFREANEHIALTLAGSVDALSLEQIQEGRTQLFYFGFDNLPTKREAIRRYYNAIPTKLPRKLDWDELLTDFNTAEEEDRLNQLEAALSTFKAIGAGSSQYDALGAVIKPVPSGDVLNMIQNYFTSTQQRGATMGQVYSVKIPTEREAWIGDQVGNVGSLWHGTRNPNVRHILKSGLRLPMVHGVANGSRFGRGIYFADKAMRSMGYTGSSAGVPKMMFLVDVALGNQLKLDGDKGSSWTPPKEYHSVWGVKSYSGNDEFIIYRPDLATIRYIITYR